MSCGGPALRSFALGLLLAALPGLGHAQPGPSAVAGPAQDTAGGAPAESTNAAPLIFEADTIGVFRVTNMGIVPERRAQVARERLEALKPRQLSQPVRIEPSGNGYTVLLGDAYMFTILDADVVPLSGQTSAQAVEIARQKLTRALAARAKLLTPGSRLRSLIAAIVATVALVVLIRLLGWGRGRLMGWMTSQSEARRGRRGVGDVVISQFSVVISWAAKISAQIVIAVLVFLWLLFVLNLFPETRLFGASARASFWSALRTFQMQALRSVPGLIAVSLLVLGARFATRLVADIFSGVERGTLRLPGIHAETAQATRRLVTTLIWVLAIVVAYPLVPGSDSDAFKGVSVFLGLILTLGSSGVVGHLMSGLVLVYSRALRPGDFVRVAEIEGLVSEVGALSVKITNAKKEEFTIPNTVMVGSIVKNYTRLAVETGSPLTTSVTIGYNAPWRIVHEMLLAAAARTPGIRKQPPPVVFQTALSDFSVEYQLVVRAERAETRVPTLSTLHQNIQDAFNERGIQIMTPHYEAQPERSVLVPKENWSQAPGDASLPSTSS